MDYRQLIHEFLDGTLDSAQEDKLLMVLSSNEELRSEFKKLLSIDRSMTKEAASISPPSKTTMALFGSLGFTAPQAVPTATPKATVGSILSKYSGNMITAVAASLVTALLFVFMFNANVPVEYNAPLISKAGPGLISPDKNMNIPVVESSEDSQNNDRPRIVYRYLRENTSTESDQSDSQIANEGEITDQPIETPDISEVRDIAAANTANKDYLRHNLINTYEFGKVQLNRSEMQPLINESDKWGITVGILGNQYIAIPGATIEESSSPRFSNMGLMTAFRLNDDLMIVLDFRQEFFFQEFMTQINNVNYKVEQHPNMVSLGVGVKYDIADLILGAKHYHQPMLSFNEAGIVLRYLLGVEYPISKDYKILFGIEGSGLIYKHRDIYSSWKIGLNYGVAFDL